MAQLNFDSLSQPVSNLDMQQYMVEAKKPNQTATYIVIAGFVLVGVFLFFSKTRGASYFVISFGALIWFLTVWVRRISARRKVKVARFAAANRLRFMSAIDNPTYKGMYFDVGDHRVLNEALVFPGKAPYEIGNYQYTVGTGKNRRTLYYGYIRILLTRRLPHMVLDGKKNNIFGMSNLPVTFDKSQVLSLEGDFNSYFTLYAPKKYEKDALYIFTPDVMAAFVDNAARADAEIIDNELYVYMYGLHNLAHQPTLEKMTKLAEAIGARVEHQADYYMDEEVKMRAANVVAVPGRRLQTRFGWSAVAIAALFFALQTASIFEKGGGKHAGLVVFLSLPFFLLTISLLLWRKKKSKK